MRVFTQELFTNWQLSGDEFLHMVLVGSINTSEFIVNCSHKVVVLYFERNDCIYNIIHAHARRCQVL